MTISYNTLTPKQQELLRSHASHVMHILDSRPITHEYLHGMRDPYALYVYALLIERSSNWWRDVMFKEISPLACFFHADSHPDEAQVSEFVSRKVEDVCTEMDKNHSWAIGVQEALMLAWGDTLTLTRRDMAYACVRRLVDETHTMEPTARQCADILLHGSPEESEAKAMFDRFRLAMTR